MTAVLLAEVASLSESQIPWSGVGTGALLSFAVWLLMTGRLVPRRTHEDALEEVRFLRQTIETMQSVKVELAQQNTKLLGDKDLGVQMLQSARAESEQASP
ncbi:hypothetical protein A6F55_19250 [Prescottella equi]|nr:hypothetical protein A6F55_19250 [Prescottella equi]